MSLTKVQESQSIPTRMRFLSILFLCFSAGTVCGCRGEVTRCDDPNWKPLFTSFEVPAANPTLVICQKVD